MSNVLSIWVLPLRLIREEEATLTGVYTIQNYFCLSGLGFNKWKNVSACPSALSFSTRFNVKNTPAICHHPTSQFSLSYWQGFESGYNGTHNLLLDFSWLGMVSIMLVFFPLCPLCLVSGYISVLSPGLQRAIKLSPEQPRPLVSPSTLVTCSLWVYDRE